MEIFLDWLNKVWENNKTLEEPDDKGNLILVSEDAEMLFKFTERIFNRKYKRFNVAFASYLENHGYEVYRDSIDKYPNITISIYKGGKILPLFPLSPFSK